MVLWFVGRCKALKMIRTEQQLALMALNQGSWEREEKKTFRFVKIAVERQRTVLMGIRTAVWFCSHSTLTRMNRTRKTGFNETLRICDENEAAYFQRARAWSMNSTECFGLMKRCVANPFFAFSSFQLCVSPQLAFPVSTFCSVGPSNLHQT